MLGLLLQFHLKDNHFHKSCTDVVDKIPAVAKNTFSSRKKDNTFCLMNKIINGFLGVLDVFTRCFRQNHYKHSSLCQLSTFLLLCSPQGLGLTRSYCFPCIQSTHQTPYLKVSRACQHSTATWGPNTENVSLWETLQFQALTSSFCLELLPISFQLLQASYYHSGFLSST